MNVIAAMSQNRKKIYLLVIVLLLGFTPLPIIQPEPKTVTIPIQAESFSFTPGAVHINQGDQVTIEFTSIDVVHGLYLDTYEVQTVSDPGETTKISFTADKVGTFRFRCSITCGSLHPFMIGKLKVGVNQLVWRSSSIALIIGLLGYWRIRND